MVDLASRTDEELLAATPTRPDAFGVFYRRHQRAVGAYFMRQTRNPELAADLSSETFATALIGAAKFKPTGAAAGWLFGIARNILLRSLERRKVEDRARRRLALRIDLTDDVIAHFEQLAGDERAELMLDGLPAQQAEALRARVIQDSSYADIAERLRCSESVVRQRVSRGLTVLRKEHSK